MQKILSLMLLGFLSFGVTNAQFTVGSGTDPDGSVAIDSAKGEGDILPSGQFNRIVNVLKNFSVDSLGRVALTGTNPLASSDDDLTTKEFVEEHLPTSGNFISNVLTSLTNYLNTNTNTTTNNFTNSILTEINHFLDNNVNNSTINNFQENVVQSISNYISNNSNTSVTNEYMSNLITEINTYTTNNPTTQIISEGKFVDGTDTNEAVYTDGNVGIGTNDPTEKLSVNAGDFVLASFKRGTTGNASGIIQFKNGLGDAVAGIGGADSNGLQLRTNGSEKVRILNNGNVGIGANNAAAKLSVTDGDILIGNSTVNKVNSGALRFSEYQTGSIQGGFLKYDGSANKLQLGVHNSNDSNIANDNNVLTILRSNGNVGIGTVDPLAKLQVNTTSPYALSLRQIANGTGSKIRFTDHNGNAQFGTLEYVHSDSQSYGAGNAFKFYGSEPSLNLHVAGNIIATGTPTASNHVVTKGYVDAQNGLTYKRLGQITGNVDWNNYGEAGTYKVQNSASSAPNSPNHTYNYGLLMVDRTAVGSEDRIMQTYVEHSGSRDTFQRMRNSGGWQAWKKLGTGSGGGKFVDGTDPTEAVYPGNVGIGTTNPAYALDIQRGNSSVASFGPNSSWGGLMTIGATTNKSTTNRSQLIATSGNAHLDSATNGSLYLNHYSGRNTFINPNGGRVGIGTTGPTQKLDLRGGMRMDHGSSYDLWIQGGSASSGNGRNLAILGVKSSDTLYINHAAEYSGGVYVHSKLLANGNISINPGQGWGLRFWNSDTYKISMANTSDHKYGPVTDYSIKNSMSNTAGRGWTWGVAGATPKIAFNTLGHAQFAGDITASAYLYSSDKRLKENIKTISEAKEIVSQLNGVTFDWKKDGKPAVGFIAQEVEMVLPAVVNTNADGFKSVGYGNIMAVAIEALKELFVDVDDNKKDIEELYERLRILESENKKLKALID